MESGAASAPWANLTSQPVLKGHQKAATNGKIFSALLKQNQCATEKKPAVWPTRHASAFSARTTAPMPSHAELAHWPRSPTHDGLTRVSVPVVPLPTDRRWKRLVLVGAFLAALALFRSLAPVLVCFVIFERSLGFASSVMAKRTPLKRSSAVASLLTALAVLVGLMFFVLVRRALPFVQMVRERGPEFFAELAHHPSVERLRSMAGLEHEPLSQVVRQHAGTAVAYATGTAHIILYLLIGFVLAAIYLFERDDLEAWTSQVSVDSLAGTLLRWFGYVADAVAVTVKMQVIVAVVSAVVTLPVLLFLGLPNVPVLFLLLLVTGLVPIVGNMIAGVVLCTVAYTSKGAWAVAVFLGVTFVLHKIESYYLNPKLAAQHVKLPGLVLIVSLLLFEQVLGFVGLFLSFPALYIASRVMNEWRLEEAALEAAATAGRDRAAAPP